MHKEIGKVVCELQSTKENPRNSEGAFMALKNGDILFVYSKFTGKTHRDDDVSCIASIVSKDDGETWSDSKVLFMPEKARNIMSVSLLRMDNDDMGMFYLVRKGWGDTRPCIRRSSDEGDTWTEPEYCTKTRGYYEVCNDCAVMLSNGRIIIPAAYFGVKKRYDPFSFRGTAVFLISDDDGHTWRESGEVLHMPIPRSRTGLQEPGIVELLNGDLWAWFRTDMGFQYESFSRDCGDTWTLPQPSIFTSSDSPMSMKRRGRTIHAIWNPRPSHFGYNAPRSPFIMACNWKNTKWDSYWFLEDPGDLKGYCYTAIHYMEGRLFLAYSVGECRKGHYSLEKLRIRKI
ncbi:MAG: sialidase family protein [Phycisphaerae bacterium]|nr:sialidase family protein [Phycisphaerae bacterium]MDD5239929.1 sialidase family protein [Candidatus Nanoarchaeia archaeon]